MTMKKSETITYLTMNGWKRDGKEWIPSDSTEKFEMQKALSTQQCLDAIVCLKREGWEVINQGNGGMRTTKLKDPQTKRSVNVNKAMKAQQERGWTPYEKAVELNGMSIDGVVNVWCPYCGKLHQRDNDEMKAKLIQCEEGHSPYVKGFTVKIVVETQGEVSVLLV